MWKTFIDSLHSAIREKLYENMAHSPFHADTCITWPFLHHLRLILLCTFVLSPSLTRGLSNGDCMQLSKYAMSKLACSCF
jgi:hypothetical protein